jgi:S1-C subfamily serine protease
MMRSSRNAVWHSGIAAVLVAVAAASAADVDRTAEYETLRSERTPAYVTVKYVQKTQSSWGDWDGEMEVTGLMVAPTGLVMCSNTLLGGGSGRWYGGRSVPTEIKILIGTDTEGLDATFIARDTELDLAWLQIDEPGARTFTHLDLDAAAQDAPAPQLGERILTLGRMGKYYGEEWLVSEGWVAGRTTKPRNLYVVRGWLDTDPGLPVYTSDGAVVGVAAVQRPNRDEVAGSPPNLTARGSGLILPIATVHKATVRAKEILAEEQAEAAAAEEAVESDHGGAASEPDD